MFLAALCEKQRKAAGQLSACCLELDVLLGGLLSSLRERSRTVVPEMHPQEQILFLLRKVVYERRDARLTGGLSGELAEEHRGEFVHHLEFERVIDGGHCGCGCSFPLARCVADCPLTSRLTGDDTSCRVLKQAVVIGL